MKQNSPMVSSNSRLCHMHKTRSLWNPGSPSLNSRCRPRQAMLCAVFMFLLSPLVGGGGRKRTNRLVGEWGWGAGRAKGLWQG